MIVDLTVRSLTSMRVLGTGFSLLSLAACGGTDMASALAESDSAGIRIVESTRPSWSETDRWRLSPLPDLVIGTPDGGEHQLFQVEDVDRLPDGRVVVTNQGTHELRVFSPEGEYLGAVGREGQGPGEFMYPSQTWVDADDSLFVRAFQRLVVFDGSGKFARSVPVSGWYPHDRFQDGTYLFVVIPPGLDRFEPGYFHPVNALVRADADGSAADTLDVVPGTELYRHTSSAGGIVSFVAPFGSLRLAATDGNEVLTGGGVSFEIRRLDPRGKLTQVFRRQTPPRPVTSADISTLEGRLLATAPPRTHPDRRRLFREWTYPAHWAAIDRLKVDEEGNIWARGYQVDGDGVGLWSVFGPSGGWLGDVETPKGLEVAQIGSDYLVGVWVDALGVEYVQIYVLEKP